METLSNPFVLIAFLLTLVVISLSVISIRIQKNNKLQRNALEQSRVRSDAEYSSIGVFFQGDKTLVKCPDCAELINIEAKICKSCTSNVEIYAAEVQNKLLALDEKNKRLRAEKQQERAQNTRKTSKYVAIGIPTILVVVILFSFITNTFFPTKIQKLASKVEVAIAECGFQNVKVTIDNKSDGEYPEYPYAFEASGKFKESPAKAECLKKSLDSIYLQFNRETLGDGHTAGYFIGGSYSGSWNNAYAKATETYTFEHHWYHFEQ